MTNLKTFIITYSDSADADDLGTEFLNATSSAAAEKAWKDQGQEGKSFIRVVEVPEEKVMTKLKLNKLYPRHWFYVSRVLASFWVKLPSRKKGEVSRYLITKPLPSVEEFKQLFTRHYTTSAESLVDDANGEIASLKDEIESWKDNIEEKFSGSEKYSQLEDALDQLERYSDIEWPADIEDFGVVYIPPVPKVFRGRVTQSRSSRLEEACDKLQTVMDGLEAAKIERVEKLRGLLQDLEEVERTDEQKEQFLDEHGISGDEDPESIETEYDDFIQEIENNKSEVEGVEFPGMYG